MDVFEQVTGLGADLPKPDAERVGRIKASLAEAIDAELAGGGSARRALARGGRRWRWALAGAGGACALALAVALPIVLSSSHVSRGPERTSQGASVPGVPSGPPAPNVATFSEAQSRAAFNVQTPSYLPPGYGAAGAEVDGAGNDVQLHFSGPNGEIILHEFPSTAKPAPVSGLAFATTVNGYPALAIKDYAPPYAYPKVQWWTGQMEFDLYALNGPVPYQEIEQMADSVPSQPSGKG